MKKVSFERTPSSSPILLRVPGARRSDTSFSCKDVRKSNTADPQTEGHDLQLQCVAAVGEVPCVFAESCASACSGKTRPTGFERKSQAWTTAGNLTVLSQPGKKKNPGYSRLI